MEPMGRTGDESSIQVPLKGLALGALIGALACLATLVIVVSVKGIDALSTVALALAILAFVVQIIVYIVQSAEVARQSVQSRELHAQLIALVSQLDERAQGTQQSVERISTRLLEAIIGKATGEGLDISSPEFARRVASGMAGGQSDQTPSITGQVSHPRVELRGSGEDGLEYPPPLDPSEAAAIQAEMRTPISAAEVEDVREAIADYDDSELWDLLRFSRDLITTTKPGASLGPGLTIGELHRVERDGLIEKLPGWKLYTLSPAGRKIGRIITAGLQVPDDAPDLEELRTRALAYDAALGAW